LKNKWTPSVSEEDQEYFTIDHQDHAIRDEIDPEEHNNSAAAAGECVAIENSANEFHAIFEEADDAPADVLSNWLKMTSQRNSMRRPRGPPGLTKLKFISHIGN